MLGGPLFCVNFKKECIKMTNANEMAQNLAEIFGSDEQED